jgi:hypothetical protein
MMLKSKPTLMLALQLKLSIQSLEVSHAGSRN